MNQRDAKAARIRGSWKKVTRGEGTATMLPAASGPAPAPSGGRAEDLAPPDARSFLKGRLALPVRDVAKLLGISSAAVRLMIHRGDLPGRKVGIGCDRITYIVPTEALLSWLDCRETATSESVA